MHRERMAKAYDVPAYYLSKLLVQVPFDTFPLLVSASVVYWCLGLHHSPDGFAVSLLLSVLVNFCSVGFAIFLSALACGRPEVASAMVAPAAIILLFLGGFYINLANIPDWIRWSFP